MKVVLILDRQASERALAGADAYWLIASPENRTLAERLRLADAFDPNSAVFDGDRYEGAEDAALSVLDNIDEHHPQWTEIEVVGIELSSNLMAKLRDTLGAAISTPRGFVLTKG